MICGMEGRYDSHLRWIRSIIGLAPGVEDYSALSLIILPRGAYFLADTYITPDPTAEEIAGMTELAVAHVRRLGIEPKVAMLSHSNFGSRDTDSARKMRRAVQILRETAPDLEVEGEMHADAALDEALRERIFRARGWKARRTSSSCPISMRRTSPTS